MAKTDMTFMNKASQITSPGKWATLNAKQMEFLWKTLDWKAIEKRVNKLQSRIAKAQQSVAKFEQLVNELLERSAVKVARSILRGG